MNHNPPQPAADRAAYYAAAESWAHDVHGAMRQSRRLAWIIAIVAATVAVLEALALLLMAPLKTSVPYVFVVDRQTGYVETARSLNPGPLTQNTAVTQSYLVQYVLARETFDVNDLRPNYRKVMLLSSPALREAYAQAMRPDNPASPLKLHRRTTLVQVTVKSVSMLGPASALVRFDADETDAGQPAQRSSYAAVIGFRYASEPLKMGDRFENPLGFTVTSYRRDAETVGPTPAAAASAP